MSLNVSLPPELEIRMRQHVESGLYSSSSEVIREALRPFEAHHGIQAASLAALHTDIAQGVADVNAGRVREVSTCPASRSAAGPYAPHPSQSDGKTALLCERRE